MILGTVQDLVKERTSINTRKLAKPSKQSPKIWPSTCPNIRNSTPKSAIFGIWPTPKILYPKNFCVAKWNYAQVFGHLPTNMNVMKRRIWFWIIAWRSWGVMFKIICKSRIGSYGCFFISVSRFWCDKNSSYKYFFAITHYLKIFEKSLILIFHSKKCLILLIFEMLKFMNFCGKNGKKMSLLLEICMTWVTYSD